MPILERSGEMKAVLNFGFGAIPLGVEVEVSYTDNDGFGTIIYKQDNAEVIIGGVEVNRYVSFEGYEYDLDDGANPNAVGDIGAGGTYAVKNHSKVRVLWYGNDSMGRECGGIEGVIEAFNHEDVPMTVVVQFPVDGKYEGDDIRTFKYFDIVPVEA